MWTKCWRFWRGGHELVLAVDQIIRVLEDRETITVSFYGDAKTLDSTTYMFMSMTAGQIYVMMTSYTKGAIGSWDRPAQIEYAAPIEVFVNKILIMQEPEVLSFERICSRWFVEGIELVGFEEIEKTQESLLQYIKNHPDLCYWVLAVGVKNKWLESSVAKKVNAMHKVIEGL